MEKRCGKCKGFSPEEDGCWGLCATVGNTVGVMNSAGKRVLAPIHVHRLFSCDYFEPSESIKPALIDPKNFNEPTLQLVRRINWMLEHWPEGE